MTIHHGFELMHDRFIEELKTQARLYRHVQTGAQLLSLINDDENKCFGITFRTPPSDSTGVAHILEHSVLCGSRKYPVKEPFVELLKGSLKTFLNAFTYPDKTCYPVASQNAEDFHNLVDVYLDAVFYPRLTPFIFQQEGWHYDLEHPDSPIGFKGVVYNEMKGAYSSPDSLLSEYSQHALFPDITYGLDSGGDPVHIPNLTFEAFLDFHRKLYHPSNARIFFCGDDDPDARLRILNDTLKEFQHTEPASAIPLQQPFPIPRRIERTFAAGSESPEGKPGEKGMVTINWLLAETLDPKLNFALKVLVHILLGMPGSPLRKALIDSGLGEDLAGDGLQTELRQITFSTGLKGIETANADRVEQLVLSTLAGLAANGIDPLATEAALNTVEFRLRENNSGQFPRGLSLMLRSLTTWLYDGDPLALIAFEEPFSAMKSEAASKPAYFEEMIDRFLLKNNHRATLLLKPDPSQASREKAAEESLLAGVKRSMTPGELEDLSKNTQELRRAQETPDSPEALATIPSLKLSDLEKKNKIIPEEILDMGGTKVLYHDIFTNGITYLDLGFDLHVLPQSRLSYVPLFGRALVEMGTHREDFVTLTQRIYRKTGGIRPRLFTSATAGNGRGTAWLLLRGKSMLKQTGELLSILRDVLLTVKLDDGSRFKQMVLEEKARMERQIIPQGSHMVNLRLRAHFGEADWVAEQVGGVSYLFFLRDLVEKVESDWPGVVTVLEDIRQRLLNRSAMVLSATVDRAGWSGIESGISDFLDSFASTPPQETAWSPEVPVLTEGMAIPAKVNYVGKGANLYGLGYRFHGSVLVIMSYLRTSWLWERVRVQGGAYGASSIFDRLSGTLTFVSYRDPNLVRTLDVFDRTAEFLKNLSLNDDEITKAIVGAIGNIDTHLLPDTRGHIAMLRHLTNDTEERRQELRDEVLATRREDFRDFAEILEQVGKKGIVKVLGPPDSFENPEPGHPNWSSILKIL